MQNNGCFALFSLVDGTDEAAEERYLKGLRTFWDQQATGTRLILALESARGMGGKPSKPGIARHHLV